MMAALFYRTVKKRSTSAAHSRFSDRNRFILTSPERRVRQRRDATGAPFSGRNEGRRQPPSAPILAESGKSREREGSALAGMSILPYDSWAAFVRQLRGPHLSTCP